MSHVFCFLLETDIHQLDEQTDRWLDRQSCNARQIYMLHTNKQSGGWRRHTERSRERKKRRVRVCVYMCVYKRNGGRERERERERDREREREIEREREKEREIESACVVGVCAYMHAHVNTCVAEEKAMICEAPFLLSLCTVNFSCCLKNCCLASAQIDHG